jgi:HAMP domain-containing protein
VFYGSADKIQIPSAQVLPIMPSNIIPESMPVLKVYFENIFWERTLITLLVGALVGVITGILPSRWLTAPLSHLQQAVQAISRHQLNTRVPEKGSLEVKSLARSFGSGLGLAIAQAFVKTHGGDITVNLRRVRGQSSRYCCLGGLRAIRCKELIIQEHVLRLPCPAALNHVRINGTKETGGGRLCPTWSK